MPFLSSSSHSSSLRRAVSTSTAKGASRSASRPAMHSGTSLTTRWGVLSVGLAIAGLSAAACGIPASHAETLRAQDQASAHTSGADPVHCEIKMDAQQGGTRITAQVTAVTAVTGTYEMALTNRAFGGRSSIRQSGEFQVSPNAPAILSESRMPGRPADQNVTLTLRIGGQTLTCGETVL